ncbi:MAG: histidine ammonia-lyase [Bdellovibrionaceae bacterium]|nr:histidine ammonia-lyase [Bdellovibrionales bacterium]MCB9253657.1 histidine ammonia-lyase [Pseudobdellovibrionaceae bacterium]
MVSIDGESLSLEKFRSVVVAEAPVELTEATVMKLMQSRDVVEKAIHSGKSIYSINTGFGVLSKVRIDDNRLEELQENLIRSHCAGVGEIHSEVESRAILLLRTNVLAKGFSGVRPELVEFLISMLNHKIHPIIPSKGSVGASGDLAPLAHLASVVIGEGEAYYQGKRLPGGQALKAAGLKPFKLAPKEGLSLINGTQQMTGLGALLLLKAEELLDLADLTSTCSLEGVLGTPAAYADWVQQTRPYPGQIRSAELLRHYMEESEIYKSHESCDRVQDPYSFRCVPQVHGAVRDLVQTVRNTLSIELNAATDNPVVNWTTRELVSNGNFHGQPVAFALDILGMGIAEIASLSERRVSKLVDPHFSDLPTFLVKEEGLNSGFMMAQVTAASLVSENRLLSHPGSTDSIPTNNEKEDHVSMGPLCARKAKTILQNTQYALAIEMLAACQALEFRKPLLPGKGPRALYAFVRKHVPPVERDRNLHEDIAKIAELIDNGDLHQFVQKTVPLTKPAAQRKNSSTENPSAAL